MGSHADLPAVRAAAKDTLVMAGGFSCREQIAQATDRRALHLADVLQMALREGPFGPAGDYPERRAVRDYSGERPALRALAPWAALAAIAAGAAWVARRR
jgi:hypothetical protein